VYLRVDELEPFEVQPKVSDVIKRLGGTTEQWAVQFDALSEVRRLARFAPSALTVAGSLNTVVERTAGLAMSLRSAVAKNALRCLGELFIAFGPKLDVDLPLALGACIRRAADTNRFISEEADQALAGICDVATEERLFNSLAEHAKHKAASQRAKAVWGIAMLAQRLGGNGGHTFSHLANLVANHVSDASPDVRLCARAAAAALVAGEYGRALPEAILAAVPAGVDLSSFDARDKEAVRSLQRNVNTGPLR